MLICDFVGTLALAGKTFKEIQKIVKDAYGHKALKQTQIYNIIKKVKEGKPAADQWHPSPQRKKWSLTLLMLLPILKMTSKWKWKTLAPAYRVWKRTIHVTLHHDFNLTKKPARWFPKLLTYDMKKERVRTSEAFPLSLHGECSTTLSPWTNLQFHFTLLRPSSSPSSSFLRVNLAQWRPRSTQPGTSKWSWPSLTSWLLLPIYTNHVPRETAVNARYICGCSGLIHEDPEEEAGDGVWRLVASLDNPQFTLPL